MDQITPKTDAISIMCCSDKWFLGSISKISTWLTPDDRHPYMLMPHKKRNSIIKNGPLYNLVTILQSSRLLWKIPARNKKYKYTIKRLVSSNLPDNMTATRSTIKDPENRPTLKVVQGLCCSPRGGTRNLFMALCLSPPSKSCVTVASVSLISRSMSLFV